MYLSYSNLITESEDDLQRWERQYRSHETADRLKMLRLLKNGTCRSRRALSHLLGYSERQLQRWFDRYRQGGLVAMLKYEKHPGKRERMTPEAWQALTEEMKAGKITSLFDAQQFLAEHFGLPYSRSGIAELFSRHKVKLKTGRRRSLRASVQEQEAFKKTVSLHCTQPSSGTLLRG